VNDADAFAGLQPALVWERFAELTRIPRPSKDEAAAREHVLAWAAGHGFASRVDAAGNVVIAVPATPGRESAPTVVLQSHLDMVCERDPDSPFDPREGRIHVVRDGDWIVGEGTTLGADNGIGVAAALAAAEDGEVTHGPLELLFTVSEEQGLDGAKALDPALVDGRILLNLDGTSDGALTVGCAGSAHAFIRVELSPERVPDGCATLAVALDGARGGHSGGDIARGRVNAIKALVRALAAASRAVPLRLASLDGGASRNAIPREALATVAVAAGSERAFEDAVDLELAAIREQHAGTDDAVAISVEVASATEAADPETSARVLDLVAAIPTGVVAMSPLASGAVETSTSLNVATTEDGVLSLASMTRSASRPALDDVVASLEALARLTHAQIEVVRSYPPWRPDPGSRLLATARATFERVFDAVPGLEVVHGGLECAVIGEKLPGVDMLAIGPTIEGPHAPGERVSVSSTQRFYRLLGALLDDLSR
jgi:dipeptidase D